MGLRLLTPPELEPVSLGEAKAYLRIDGTLDEDLIVHLIKTARHGVEAFTNRCLIEQIWCFEINAGYASALADDHYIDASHSKGQRGIEIPRSPFLALQGKPLFCESTTQSEITNYKLDTQGPVARLHLGHCFLNSSGTIRITFKAGYGNSSEHVPASLKQAILMLMASAYENRTGANDNASQPVFMNDRVIQLISPYRVMRLG